MLINCLTQGDYPGGSNVIKGLQCEKGRQNFQCLSDAKWERFHQILLTLMLERDQNSKVGEQPLKPGEYKELDSFLDLLQRNAVFLTPGC